MTEYFGFKEAMQYLGIKSHNTLNYYIQQGLPVTKIGKSKRISKTAIDDFMKDHTVASASNIKGMYEANRKEAMNYGI